jgi:hypothetical protein
MGQITITQPNGGTFQGYLIIAEPPTFAPQINLCDDDVNSGSSDPTPFAGYGNENITLSRTCGNLSGQNLTAVKYDLRNSNAWQYSAVNVLDNTFALELNFVDSVGGGMPILDPCTIQYFSFYTFSWVDITVGNTTIQPQEFMPSYFTTPDSLGYARVITIRMKKQNGNGNGGMITPELEIMKALDIVTNTNNTAGIQLTEGNQTKELSGRFELYSINGQLIESGDFENGYATVTNTNENTGTNMCIVRFILSDGEVVTRKLIING